MAIAQEHTFWAASYKKNEAHSFLGIKKSEAMPSGLLPQGLWQSRAEIAPGGLLLTRSRKRLRLAAP